MAAKIGQDSTTATKRREYLDRIEHVQSQLIWCYTATLRATFGYIASEFLTQEEWRALQQATDMGRAAHHPDMKPDASQRAARPLITPLTYPRVLDVKAAYRGHPIPGEDRTWRELLIAQLRESHEGISQLVEANRHEIPFSLEQRLSVMANVTKNMAEIYERREEDAQGRSYLERSLPLLMWTGAMAEGQLIRIQVGVD